MSKQAEEILNELGVIAEESTELADEEELEEPEAPPKEKLPELTDEQVAQFRAKYKSFQTVNEDTDQKLPMMNKDLSISIRELGFHPTQGQIKAMLDAADPDRLGFIELKDYLHQLRILVQFPVPRQEDIRACFKVFDKENNGFLPTAQIRHILTSLGEALTEPEIDEMMRIADGDGEGEIKYDNFVDVIYDPDAKIWQNN